MVHLVSLNLIFSLLLSFAYQGGPAPAPPVAPDHSLTTEAYIQKGLPADDRTWGVDDYAQAASVLQALAAEDAARLPRYGSPTSGAIFARITSGDNLKLIRNQASPLPQRVALALAVMESTGNILTVYFTATTPRQVFDSEMVELLRFLLEDCRELVPLVEKVAASIPADDPDREARLKGLEQLHQGLAMIVSGSLTTLTEKQAYRLSELARLAETIESVLPVLFPSLPPDMQKELPVRLRRMAEQESDSNLKEKLNRLLAALNKSKAG